MKLSPVKKDFWVHLIAKMYHICLNFPFFLISCQQMQKIILCFYRKD